MVPEVGILFSRILLIGGMSALMPSLKAGSLTQPFADPSACEEALHAGASCTVCVSKFKMCRGHFVYEPFTVVLFEAFATILLGALATFAVVPSFRKAWTMLADWDAIKRVAPIGATYALGDVMDLIAAGRCSPTTLVISSQLRLPLCALLRWILLGRGQTRIQWVVLYLISLLCARHVATEMKGGLGSQASGSVLELIPLIFGKCVISCAGAVHAEYFLQHGGVKHMPLCVTQAHFKLATVVGAVTLGLFQGRRGGRILAPSWDGQLFQILPPGVHVGDARMPFFGGWNVSTWVLVAGLVANNFLIGDQLRRVSSVAKYVAYALGLVVSHAIVLASSQGADVDPMQTACCAGIAILAVIYVRLPAPEATKKLKTEEEKAELLDVAKKVD